MPSLQAGEHSGRIDVRLWIRIPNRNSSQTSSGGASDRRAGEKNGSADRVVLARDIATGEYRNSLHHSLRFHGWMEPVDDRLQSEFRMLPLLSRSFPNCRCNS